MPVVLDMFTHALHTHAQIIAHLCMHSNFMSLHFIVNSFSPCGTRYKEGFQDKYL